MIVLRARLLSPKIAANACKAFATEKTKTPKYWHNKFPDKKPRSFDEMPTVEEPQINPYDLHEVFPLWFKKYGYIVRSPVGNGKYTVHSFHFDDFQTIYKGDSIYYNASRRSPERPPHQVLKDYREHNRDLYDNDGLGPGNGDYVDRIRGLIMDRMNTGIDEKMENVTEDLIQILGEKVGKGGDIELLPWLFRWVFESVGLKFLDTRLGALYDIENEETDKMEKAAQTTNEMVALMTLDPLADYAERYQKLETAQNYFYSALKKYMEQVAAQPDSKSAVKKLLENNMKDAITVTLDAFEGALQTVPLSVLMALYNVSRNKEIQVQAREQAVKYLQTKDSKYCLSDNTPPIFISHIILETLRFNPPIIGNARTIKSDMVLGGYNVPKETNVILHFQVASRLEEFYKDALKFNPDRFKSTNADRVMEVFGFGSCRACIGAKFAIDTMYLILLKMLRNFEFSHDGEEIAMINRLYNKPKYPLILKLKPLPE